MFLNAALLVAVAAAAPSPKPAAQYCAGLLVAVQGQVRVALTVALAQDATSDATHTDEPGFYSCVFGAGDGLTLTVTLSDFPAKRFTNLSANGWQPLAGCGDRARMMMRRVQIMSGPTFCEVVAALRNDQFVRSDWVQASGKACMAAYAAR